MAHLFPADPPPEEETDLPGIPQVPSFVCKGNLHLLFRPAKIHIDKRGKNKNLFLSAEVV